jgi:hypothetical protein
MFFISRRKPELHLNIIMVIKSIMKISEPRSTQVGIKVNINKNTAPINISYYMKHKFCNALT